MCSMNKVPFRIGQSRDIHRLEENGRTLILGGVKLPFYKGPVSHSDGDCLYHAIGEALLGALAKGDLGKLFPDNDARYKEIVTSVDLDYIKDVAMNQLGMQYATEEQVIYYSVENNNFMDQYSDIPE